MELVALGLVAGVLTTVAGMGGGVMLLLVLGLASGDPVRALAVATPALLLGNLHRLWLYRSHLPRALAFRFAGAALVGAVLGGALALAVPPGVVQGALVASTLAAVAQHLSGRTFAVPASWLGAAGLGIGVASTAGGAGLLSGPVLLSAGLSGGGYLATSSLGAVAMHVGRLLALGSGGAITAATAHDAALLAVAIPFGNVLGRHLRGRASEQALLRLEVATGAGLVGLSLLGLLGPT